MNTQPPPQIEGSTAPQRSWLPWILLALLLIPLLACLVFAVVTIGGASQAVDLVRNVLDGGEIMVIDRQPAVITQIRELGRLETARATACSTCCWATGCSSSRTARSSPAWT